MSHINLGSTGIIVQYIQNFLKDNYDNTFHLSDEYDKETHKKLIKYLRLPIIIDSNTMKDYMISKYTFKNSENANELEDGGGIWNFDYEMTTRTIRFYNRDNNFCFDGALRFLTEYVHDIDDFCRQHGWYLKKYNKAKYNRTAGITKQVSFEIAQEGRKQLLPCAEIINMINFHTNDYLLNKCFLDENNAYHGFIQNSNLYKVAYIPAKPGDSFTISHGFKYPCEMAFAYSEQTIKELKESNHVVNNIVSHMSKSAAGELYPGDYDVYTIPEDSECTYLLIQMPYDNALINPTNKKTTIVLGDINQDGIIDFNEDDENSDYMILKRYVTEKSFNLSQSQLVAANLNKDIDINGKPIVNETDLRMFEAAITEAKKTGNTILNFGTVEYERETTLAESNQDRLLVMYGDVDLGNPNNQLNIPIEDFQTEPWAIHEEFLPYILGSAIHKYSNIEDITWLQNQVKTINPNYKELRWGYYDSPIDYISNEKFVWNEIKSRYELYNNNNYTGYYLYDSVDIMNGYIASDKTKRITNVKIENGQFLENNVLIGKSVLESGYISINSSLSLREHIINFQVASNTHFNGFVKEQIKFINGYVTPITEKRLKDVLSTGEFLIY